MHNEIILSICIPTYNRSKLLTEALDSIIISLNGFEDKVEIIVSDNASYDDTIDVVKKYQSKHNLIRYNRNTENVIDKNFFIAASLARGKYIWIFADDDKMEEQAVTNVLNFINQNYNLIICNYSIWNNDFTVKLKERFFNISKNIEFNNHNVILKKLGNKLQFLSSIVIEKNTFFNLDEEEYNSLHEYGISFAFSLYCGIMNNVKAILIAEPQLQYRGNNSPLTDKKTWYKYFASGASLLFERLRKKGYSNSAIYSAKNIALKTYIMHDISYRKRTGENLNGIFKLILPYYKYQILFWIMIVPMIISPKFILVFVNKIVVVLRNLRKLIFVKSFAE
jgi:glycosyltransferase involved in cell wall biosynthesis